MFLFEMAAIPFPCNVFWLLWSIYLISLIYSIELFISQIVRFHTMEYRDRIKRLKMRRSLVYLGVPIEAPQQMTPGQSSSTVVPQLQRVKRKRKEHWHFLELCHYLFYFLYKTLNLSLLSFLSFLSIFILIFLATLISFFLFILYHIFLSFYLSLPFNNFFKLIFLSSFSICPFLSFSASVSVFLSLFFVPNFIGGEHVQVLKI